MRCGPLPRQLTFADLEFQSQDSALDPILKAISNYVDAHPEWIEWVHEDLVRGLKNPKTGRRGLNAERLLRALILQRIKDWDYRELQERIAGDYALRGFTRFWMDGVPDHKAFHRGVNRLRPETVHALVEGVVKSAVDDRLENGKRVRIDCTAVETDIHYPTDGALLWDTVRVLTRLVFRLGERFPETLSDFHNRTRRAKRRAHELSRLARGKGKRRPMKPKYRDLIAVTEEVIRMAREATARVKDATFRDPLDVIVAATLPKQIEHFCHLGECVIHQTRRRVLYGETVPAQEKIVSIFETHTDIIVRGKARKPTEFGHKVFVAEMPTGLIADFRVLEGNPPDETLVPSVLEKHQQVFGATPKLISGDRGFYSDDNLKYCDDAGVGLAAFPQRGGKKSAEREAHEKSRTFKDAQRFRAGVEGRISVLFRGRGMARCRLHGRQRFEVFVGSAILANNLLKIADAKLAREEPSRPAPKLKRPA